jgi:DNA topoisomerase VI subunit B
MKLSTEVDQSAQKNGHVDTASLQRTHFSTSRLLEFFSETELAMQIGHSEGLWPLALAKELVDNAMDACEKAGIPPALRITVRPDALTVADNGPGLPTRVLERSLDYAVRVSDKSHYVSPTRGQLGNALKCIWAAPFVAGGCIRGLVEVSTGGARHAVEVSLDRITQTPQLSLQQNPSVVKTGTHVRLNWPGIATAILRAILRTSFTTSNDSGAPTPPSTRTGCSSFVSARAAC